MSKIPKFRSVKQEAEYWATHSAADVLEDTTPVEEEVEASGNLKRRVEARLQKRVTSLRLSQKHIDDVKKLAEKKGIGYQTLLRIWIIERLEKELVSKKVA